MKIKICSFKDYASEPTVRNDTLFLNTQKKCQDFYTFKDLFEIIFECDKKFLSGEFCYAEIGNVDNNGYVTPVRLNFDNQEGDLANQAYYVKISKGDIQKCQEGDILVSKIRPYLKKNIYIDEEKSNIYFTSAFICLRPKIHSKLMFYLLNQFFLTDLIAISRQGKGYPTLKESDLYFLKFDKTVVDTIINASKENMDKINEREKQIKELEAKKEEDADIINDVFSDYFKYPKNIPQKIRKGMTFGTQISKNTDLICFNSSFSGINDKSLRFSTRSQNPIFIDLDKTLLMRKHFNVSDILKCDINRGSTPKYKEDGDIPVIKTAHITSNNLKYNFTEFTDKAAFDKSRFSQVSYGDILMASSGKPSVGKIDLVEKNIKAVVDSHISLIKIDPELYNKRFFVYFFRSVLGYYQIERDVTGCTNQIELSSESIEQFIIPDIPLIQQEKIVNMIDFRINKQQKIDIKIAEKFNEIGNILKSLINK